MISVTVLKDPGDKQGPDIQSAMISTEAAARERGRQEISQNWSDKELITGSCRYLGMQQAGVMAQLTNARTGTKKGLLRRHNIVVERKGFIFSATSHVEIEFLK